ncbi:MAG: hypothetical protein ABSH05_26025 [Bryobacteraceae bacterium]
MLERKPAVGAAACWALAGWAACGLTLGVCRAVWGFPAALWLHLAAAPIIFFVVTVFYWNHPRHPGPAPTAALFLAMVFGLDLLIVAPFFERGFGMFASAMGTWIPFGLIFLGSLAAGMLLSTAPARRPVLRWMPTQSELWATLPGDACLDVEEGSTHAISIAAEPDRIWPWLVQMGYGRGGWYSHDWLDNWGRRSATKILPEYREIKPGDMLPTTPNGRFGFEVLEAEPGRHLVLSSHLATRPMRSIPWNEPSPPAFIRATWTFVLERADGGQTRLLVRARSTSAPAWRWSVWNGFFWAAHVVMQRKQLLNLKRRAQGTRATAVTDAV